MKRILFGLTSTLLVLTGCGPKAENAQAPAEEIANSATPPAAPVPAAAVTPGQLFANTAAAGDAFEIAISTLALEKSSSSAIKSFARAMIGAHTQSTTKLKAAASATSPAVNPDPTLTAAQQEKLAALQGKSGVEFDRAYAAEQVAAHDATLQSLRAYAASPDAAPLGGFASEMVPIVTAHLNMAKALKP